MRLHGPRPVWLHRDVRLFLSLDYGLQRFICWCFHILLLPFRVRVPRCGLNTEYRFFGPALIQWLPLDTPYSDGSAGSCHEYMLARSRVLTDPRSLDPSCCKLPFQIWPCKSGMPCHSLACQFAKHLFSKFCKRSSPCTPCESLPRLFPIMADGKS